MNKIDFRSDTITKPPKEMLEAMINADVGDDVLGDDPSVIELEESVAKLTGKERSLFVSSGIMGNQLALYCQTEPGDEIIVEESSHIFRFEAGAAARNSSVQTYPIRGNLGIMSIDDIKKAIRPQHDHYAKTTFISLENTHNWAGGCILPLDYIKEIYEIAKNNNMYVHIDGARIFNAVVETGISVLEYAKYCDTITFCLSKGLSCPVGSVLSGSAEFVEKARQTRLHWGGGMRQSGYLAACGIYAINNMIDRLKEDNDNAKYLAKRLAEIDFIDLNPEHVHTNIIFFRLNDNKTSGYFVNYLNDNKIYAFPRDEKAIRFVINRHVNREMIDRAVDIIRQCPDC